MFAAGNAEMELARPSCTMRDRNGSNIARRTGHDLTCAFKEEQETEVGVRPKTVVVQESAINLEVQVSSIYVHSPSSSACSRCTPGIAGTATHRRERSDTRPSHTPSSSSSYHPAIRRPVQHCP